MVPLQYTGYRLYRRRHMPADDAWRGTQDVLCSVIAICIGKVIGPNKDDHSFWHVDGRELPASLQPPQQVP